MGFNSAFIWLISYKMYVLLSVPVVMRRSAAAWFAGVASSNLIEGVEVRLLWFFFGVVQVEASATN